MPVCSVLGHVLNGEGISNVFFLSWPVAVQPLFCHLIFGEQGKYVIFAPDANYEFSLQG